MEVTAVLECAVVAEQVLSWNVVIQAFGENPWSLPPVPLQNYHNNTILTMRKERRRLGFACCTILAAEQII